jgi:hypothetical protein
MRFTSESGADTGPSRHRGSRGAFALRRATAASLIRDYLQGLRLFFNLR